VTKEPPLPPVSVTHLVLIPSYNTGPKLFDTVREARGQWAPVWVVIDGSTDGTGVQLEKLAGNDPHLRVLPMAENRGKGAAILHGLRAAHAAGFTHVLTMDADGQHPAGQIPHFMQASAASPDALVLGVPQFDATAPRERILGRKISNALVMLETLGPAIRDCLFGFRVYPLAPLLDLMESRRWMRRFDFDTEAAVRLVWQGRRCINIPVPVRYLSRSEGGVSHFRYGRDNLLLAGMHLRLAAGFLLRLPILLPRALRRLFNGNSDT
jgi:glycosyltransferase involved in cell wall biosynthesis